MSEQHVTPSAENDAGLRVTQPRCEVCRREGVPLRSTRGFGALNMVQRCVDAAACFTAWSELTRDIPPGGGRA